jgi:general stress protein 26
MAQAPASQGNSAEAASHLVSMLREFSEAILVTRSRAGGLHGRPMSIAQVDDNATIWFVTSVASAKVDEMADDSRATVMLQSASRFACLNGNVELVFARERVKALWRDSYRVWFDGASDPDLVLVRFTAFDAEYWDKSGVQGLKQALLAVRAYVTRNKLEQKPELQNDPASHAKLKLWEPNQRVAVRDLDRTG